MRCHRCCMNHAITVSVMFCMYSTVSAEHLMNCSTVIATCITPFEANNA